MEFLITKFGAVGDGSTLDTYAIQAAIDAAHSAGGGRVIVPSNRVFYSGSLILKANVELHLEVDAVLLASGDYLDYPAHLIAEITGGEVVESVLPQRAFIAGFRAHDAKITGVGEINGNADAFIESRGQYIHQMKAPVGGRSQYLERPFTIFLIESEDIEFVDFTIRDPAFWALRITGCNNSQILGIKILTDLMVPNADGIDIDRCQNVQVTGCELVTADDCISLKSCAATAQYGDVSDIAISDCYMVTTSGAITLGTESAGDIKNVLVTNCEVKDSHRGFAVRAREGGEISNVRFVNSRIQTRTFSPMWWGHGEALHVTAFAWSEPELLGDGNPERLLRGTVRDIVFENLDVVSEAGVLNWAQDDSLVSGVTYRNVRVKLQKQSTWPSRIDLRPNDIEPVVERKNNGFEIVNCQNVHLIDCNIIWDATTRSDYAEAIHESNAKGLIVSGYSEKTE